MTTKPKPLPAPVEGGSYLRQKDGSLKRVEFTDVAPVAVEAAAEQPPVAGEG